MKHRAEGVLTEVRRSRASEVEPEQPLAHEVECQAELQEISQSMLADVRNFLGKNGACVCNLVGIKFGRRHTLDHCCPRSAQRRQLEVNLRVSYPIQSP